LVVLAAALLVPGCGGVRQAAARQKRANELKIVGLAYHNYMDANGGKAPQQAADLQQYTMGDPGANAALTDGSLVFVYGVKLADMTGGASSTVIAYESQVPQSGGHVIMGDGSVMTVTAQGFQGMTVAKPTQKE
jgi:hypothetical protein